MQSFLSANLQSSKTRLIELKARATGKPAIDNYVAVDGEVEAEVERELFAERLRREAKRHDAERHPFNLRMLEGRLSSEEIRLWLANHYYYLTRVPMTHALILSKTEEPLFRRRWLKSMNENENESLEEGTLAAWERLAEAAGLDRAALKDASGVLIGVRFACDAYMTFLREASLSEAVVASLAEVLTPELNMRRLPAFARYYSWIDADALSCLRSGLDRQRASDLLADRVSTAVSHEAREACVAAVIKKSQILWHILDCIDAAGRTRAM